MTLEDLKARLDSFSYVGWSVTPPSSATQRFVDRSDAKITVRSIQLDACTVHAEWARD